MSRTLSSRATPLLKFVLPPFWIGAAGYVIGLLWMHPERVLGEAGSAAGTLALQGLFFALVIGSLLILWAFVLPLKRVQLAADGLRVSNFVRETTIPFSAIARVRQNWLPTFRLITLDMRAQTPLGRRVIFMPAVPQRMAFWRAEYRREDEMVRELRSLAGLADPQGSRIAAV